MDDWRADAVELVGQWRATTAGVVADDVARRIEWLVAERLVHVAADASGWDVLYRDPRDGRLWERTYLDSGAHGGGPPRLALFNRGAAEAKYGPLAV